MAAAIAKTPARANLALARNVPLPPSPAVITDAIERRTAVVRTQMNRAWDHSGLTERAEGWRQTLSSVTTIELIVLAVECFYLRSEVLPSRDACTSPAVALLRSSDWPVYLPDLFFLLTATFWAPFTLWATTSLGLPLLFAYFFNLTLKHRPGSTTRSTAASNKAAHNFDPLMFNVAKALVSFLVYSQDYKLGGLIGDDSVETVKTALPGGTQGVLITSGIGALASLYDAVLKK